jgi:PPK2 family polyphosphate:nucleotide phosphotransferase
MDRYRIDDGADFQIAEWDPADRSAFDGGKKEAGRALAKVNERLEQRQEQLYAQDRHRVLLILQGMDTAGKSGTIRRIFQGVNPAGVRVSTFKSPTEAELARDFLWRVHPHVPQNGQIAVFDRSHYEDVLIVRVRELVPERRWKARYRHIRDFEQMLVDEGTTICKIFLHLSFERQRERLQARLDNPEKHWKFRLNDIEERHLWEDYQAAYEALIRETATPDAPWYVVPADRKWYRNLVAAQTVLEKLDGLDLFFPPSPDDLDGAVVT